MTDLAEVVTPGPITRVPGLPGWLPGLTAWRGRLLAVLDLERYLDGAETPGAIVVLRRGELELGLACAEVSGMLDIDIDTVGLVATPGMVSGSTAALLTGHVITDGDVIGVLDPGSLFALRSRLPARASS